MKPPERVALLERMLAAVPDDLETFDRLCAGVRDWEAFLELAYRQRVEALLEYYLLRLPQRPAGIGEAYLEKQLALKRLRQVRPEQRLDEVLQTLAAAGVPTVMLKGPVLAQRFYPEPSLRPTGDLDLLFEESDLDRATAALTGIGYEAEQGPPAEYHWDAWRQTRLTREAGTLLELHFRLDLGFGTTPSGEFLSRALPYRTRGGSPVSVLGPEDEALYLATHAAKHRFEYLMWLYDLKLLLRRYPDLDWPAVAARARSLRVARAVAMAWQTLQRRLGVPVPQNGALAPVGGLRGKLAGWILSPPATRRLRPRTVDEISMRVLLCDRPVASAWLFRHRLWSAARRRARRYFHWDVPKVPPR